MYIDLSGKRALVTGASSGIGATIAEVYAAAGAHVAVHARTLAKAEGTVQRIEAAGGRAFAVAADLEDSGAISDMCNNAIKGLGGIDIVMNNAGFFTPAEVVAIDEDSWHKAMTINLKAPTLIAKVTIPVMIEQGRGGRQLFTSSISAKIALVEDSVYSAAKAGVNSLARCLAMEVGKYGITVNTICPGWVDTPMARRAFQDMLEEGQSFDEFYRQGMSENALQTVIKPVDIANMAAYLASEQGRCITGQAINVCAGMCPTL